MLERCIHAAQQAEWICAKSGAREVFKRDIWPYLIDQLLELFGVRFIAIIVGANEDRDLSGTATPGRLGYHFLDFSKDRIEKVLPGLASLELVVGDQGLLPQQIARLRWLGPELQVYMAA